MVERAEELQGRWPGLVGWAEPAKPNNLPVRCQSKLGFAGSAQPTDIAVFDLT